MLRGLLYGFVLCGLVAVAAMAAFPLPAERFPDAAAATGDG